MKYFWNISKISRCWTTDNIDQNTPNQQSAISNQQCRWTDAGTYI